MKKIEKLIDALCPDSVEFKALWDVFNIKNGYTPSKAKSEFWTLKMLFLFQDHLQMNA